MNPVFPSILSTNFFDLHSKLSTFEESGIDYIHLDVMDGHFVDNISFGPSAAKAIKSQFPFKIDAHLMVSNPGKMISKYLAAGCDWVSFHIETQEDIHQNIQLIKKEDKKAGLVLNPDTPVEKVFPFIPHLDYVLLMSVFPGYGGQKFPLQHNQAKVTKKQSIVLECGECKYKLQRKGLRLKKVEVV